MNYQTESPVRRYDIWMADLPEINESHVQSGIRPVVVVSNDLSNIHSPIVNIIPLTSNLSRVDIPTHIVLHNKFLQKVSLALCDQIMTLDKSRLMNKLGAVEGAHQRLTIQHCIQVQLGLVS